MRSIVTLLITLASVGVASAQITIATVDLGIPDYHEKLRHIVNTQIVNYRTVVEEKEWDWFGQDLTKPPQLSRWVGVHGSDLWVSRIAIQPPYGDGKDYYVHVVSSDEAYCLHRKPDVDGYTIFKYETVLSNPQSYASSVHWCLATRQLFKPSELKEVLGTTEDEYEGRLTIRVTFQTKFGATTTTHIDRKTYQHIYSETDKIREYKTYTYVEGKRIEKTEYRSEGGRLWPTRHEDYIIKTNGKKYPTREFTFLEYTPYTATADELDIEKQFGVKPVPPDQRPAPAVPKSDVQQPKPEPAKPKTLMSQETRQYAAIGILTVSVILALLIYHWVRR